MPCPTTDSAVRHEHDRAAKFMMVLSVITALAGLAIACLNGLPTLTMALWIYSQAFLAAVPGLIVWRLLNRRLRQVAPPIGASFILAVPCVMILDAMVYNWIGHRMWSSAVWRAVTELRDSLTPHLGFGTAWAFFARIAGSSVLVASIWFTAKAITARWPDQPCRKRVFWTFASIAMLAAFPALSQFNRTLQNMASNSTQHPLCVFRIPPFGDLGLAIPPTNTKPDPSQLDLPAVSKQAIAAREMGIRTLSVEAKKTHRPDIVIVVIESFRRELVDPQGMPTLWDLSQRGVFCVNHFSGGNATNHGMFSLFNGLEAVWFEQPVRFTPLLNRLFHAAGYEIGFFAGHDQWRDFYMDGFLNEDHFDEFRICAPNGLDSDRAATQQASTFLARESASESERVPRLAVLYLYGTHATFQSYAQDQIFQPAADDRFLYPFDSDRRDEVWNRYRNSARTADRFLSAVASDERIVLVTGDHGEAFLEDDTIGHGVRISEVQNMTPAVLYLPNQEPRVIQANTSHIDLLPTLVSAAGINLTNPKALDGFNWLQSTDNELNHRVFATRNYLQTDVALIGPWTLDPNGPFAFRVNVSLRQMQMDALDAIDRRGMPMPHDKLASDDAVSEWAKLRFGKGK